jgi:hypothetical protein
VFHNFVEEKLERFEKEILQFIRATLSAKDGKGWQIKGNIEHLQLESKLVAQIAGKPSEEFTKQLRKTVKRFVKIDSSATNRNSMNFSLRNFLTTSVLLPLPIGEDAGVIDQVEQVVGDQDNRRMRTKSTSDVVADKNDTLGFGNRPMLVRQRTNSEKEIENGNKPASRPVPPRRPFRAVRTKLTLNISSTKPPNCE